MTIESFNKSNIDYVRSEINKKLEELQSLGLELKLGNIKYSDSSFTAKLECVIEGENLYELEFQKSLKFIQYPDAIGKEIEFQNKKYTFVGFKPRARTRHALIENTSGQLYRIEFSSISSQLKKL